jgi:gliding motility-associated lipoprotein GldH
MNRIAGFVCALFTMVMITSCGPDRLVYETVEIEQGSWVFQDSKRFSVEVTDTLTPYNFYALVRHGGDYPYQNLILLVKTYFPNNTFVVDTIDCPLADKQGNWYGGGLGDLLDNRILFKRNIQMPMAGRFNIELQHAMRPDTIHEIYDIGIEIESALN